MSEQEGGRSFMVKTEFGATWHRNERYLKLETAVRGKAKSGDDEATGVITRSRARDPK